MAVADFSLWDNKNAFLYPFRCGHMVGREEACLKEVHVHSCRKHAHETGGKESF